MGWNIQINVPESGVNAFSPGSMARFTAPTGYYKGIIKENKIEKSAAGNEMAVFEVDGITGGAKGQRGFIRLMVHDKGDGTVALAKWIALLCNVHPEAQVLAHRGVINLGEEMFTGKEVCFHCRQYPGEKDVQGRDKLPDLSFVSPSEYEKGLKAEQNLGTPAAAGLGAVPQPAAGGLGVGGLGGLGAMTASAGLPAGVPAAGGLGSVPPLGLPR